jgi:hypothetical protein
MKFIGKRIAQSTLILAATFAASIGSTQPAAAEEFGCSYASFCASSCGEGLSMCRAQECNPGSCGTSMGECGFFDAKVVCYGGPQT